MRPDPRPRLLVMAFSPLRSDARVLRQVRLFSGRYAVTTLGYGEAPDGVVEHLRLPDDVVSWHKDRRLLMSRRYEAAYRTSSVVRAAADLLAGGVGAWRGEPFPDRTPLADAADPLPQAFVLTAIVIAMATTTILLTLAALGHDDDTDIPEPADDNIGADPVETLGRAASRSNGEI